MPLDLTPLGPKTDPRPIERSLPVTVHVPLAHEPDPAALAEGVSRDDYLRTLPRLRLCALPGEIYHFSATGTVGVVIDLRPEDGARVIVLRDDTGSYSPGTSIHVSDLELNSAVQVVFG